MKTTLCLPVIPDCPSCSETVSAEEIETVFLYRFGAANPMWRLCRESRAIEILDVYGNSNVVVPLGAQCIERIQALGETLSACVLVLDILGVAMQVRLNGRRGRNGEWNGIVVPRRLVGDDGRAARELDAVKRGLALRVSA